MAWHKTEPTLALVKDLGGLKEMLNYFFFLISPYPPSSFISSLLMLERDFLLW